MGKKFLIIQPHSDDALFCCSNILFSEDTTTKILTVENDAKRIKEDENLYSFLNIPFEHLNVEFKDESYYGFKKEYKEVNRKNSEEYLKKFFSVKKLIEIKKSIIKYVNDFMKINKRYEILIPLGVGHPFHNFVKHVIVDEFSTIFKLHFYREFPHSYKRRVKSQMERYNEIYELEKFYETESISDVKWSLASRFYKSQSSLLFFEQGYIKKDLNEEIYKQKLKF